EKQRWVENITLRPSTLALKLSTKRSSSSASVDAPGSSTWIQRAPSVIKASRLGRIKFRATSRTNSRRAALRSRMRSAAGCSRFSGAPLRSSNDQSAIVYAPVTGILSSASATDTRYENSALWKGEHREIEQTLVPGNLEPLAPGARFLQVLVVQRLASVSLHAPAGLVERADLVGQQRLVLDDIVHTDTSSFTLRAASPRRCTFCSATTV